MGARRLVLALCLSACAGPQPRIEAVHVAPAPQPGQTRVTATLVNGSRGDGEVKVTVRLHDRLSHEVFEDQHSVELRGRESLRLVFDLRAPSGTYDAEVVAKYPPE